MSAAPTLLLVHGAWHGAWVWDRFRQEVPDLRTMAVDLPSAGDPAQDISGDVAVVRAAVEQITGPVVVVAHSFGGLVASEALEPGSSVDGIIFLAARMPEAGETMTDEQGREVLPPFWDVRDGGVSVLDPREVLFHDVPEPEASAAVARLVPQSLASLRAVPTRAAWHRIPSTYVVCEDDHTFPTAAQDVLARRALRVRRLPGGHSPMLARPARLAEIVRAELDLLD